MVKAERQSNIELLRIFAMIGVIILHYIASPGHVLENAIDGGGYYSIALVNSLYVCAVDLFVFISGFFMWKSKEVSVKKPIQLLVEVILFQELLAFVSVIHKGEAFRHCLGALMPKNYFVTLYIALYLISPLINKSLNSLTKEQYKYWLTALVLLFSIEPILIDVLEGIKGADIMGASTIGILGSEWGYTIVTFLLIYVIGAYCGRFEISWSKKKCVCIALSTVLILTTWKIIEIRLGRSIGAEHYQNPVIILEAVAIFMLFSHIKIQSKIVNQLSKTCFTVFLVHANFINKMPIANLRQLNAVTLVANILIKATIIFLLSALVGLVYSTVEKKTFDKIEEKWDFYRLGIK